jgi:hypothetical protein
MRLSVRPFPDRYDMRGFGKSADNRVRLPPHDYGCFSPECERIWLDVPSAERSVWIWLSNNRGVSNR